MPCLIGILNERRSDSFIVLSVMVLRKAYLIVAQMRELVDVEHIKMLLSYVMVLYCIVLFACAHYV